MKFPIGNFDDFGVRSRAIPEPVQQKKCYLDRTTRPMLVAISTVVYSYWQVGFFCGVLLVFHEIKAKRLDQTSSMSRIREMHYQQSGTYWVPGEVAQQRASSYVHFVSRAWLLLFAIWLFVDFVSSVAHEHKIQPSTVEGYMTKCLPQLRR